MRILLTALAALVIFGSYALANLILVPPPVVAASVTGVWTTEGGFQRTAAREVWTTQGSLTTP
jgi:hypothetical protein